MGGGEAETTSKRDQRRDRILNVARECFLRDGYAGCSMSAIAGCVGGSKGTLYNYFPSKEDLFEAFVRRTCTRFSDQLAAAPPVGDNPRSRLLHFAGAFLDHLLSPDAIAVQRLVIGEGGRFPELGRMFYAAGPGRVIAILEGEIAGLMSAGQLRRADARIAAMHFKDLAISGLQHLLLWGVVEPPGEQELAAFAANGVDTFLRAYAPD
jgi:AcrR family transcriptional regulator